MTGVTRLVVEALLQDDPVADIVGSAIFPLVIPQGQALPALTVSRVAEEEDITINGSGGRFESRVTVACHATDYRTADELGEAVKSCLTALVHAELEAGAPPVAIGIVTAWKASGDISDYSPDLSVFRRSIDFYLRWWTP